MGFYLLLEIWVKIFVKILLRVLAVSIAKKFLIMLNNLQQMHLKLLQKESFKNLQEQLGI